MGAPIPVPPVIGSACSCCDNILWGPGATPRFITVEFADILPCPSAPAPAPNGSWIFTQDPSSPCTWRYADADYEMLYFLEPWESDLRCWKTSESDTFYFRNDTGHNCRTGFTNEYINCWAGWNVGMLGTGKVLLP